MIFPSIEVNCDKMVQKSFFCKRKCFKTIAKTQLCDIIAQQEQLKPLWGYGSVGRASRSQCEGQGFESPYLHQKYRTFCAIFFCIRGLCVIKSHSRLSPCEPLCQGWRYTLQVNLRVSLLRKLLDRFLRIPLSPPVRIQVEPLNLYSFFYAIWGELKFHDAIKRLVDEYACNFVVTRNSR